MLAIEQSVHPALWNKINTILPYVAIQLSINNSASFHTLNSQHVLISNAETFHCHFSSYHQRAISPARGMHERGRLGLGYFQQHSHGIHLVVGWLDLRQLYQGYPEGPDVSLIVVWTVLGCFAHYHLWGHPAKVEVSGFVIRIKQILDYKQIMYIQARSFISV